MLADELGGDIVPMPPDSIVAARLAEWWTKPRAICCPHVQRDGYWFVVYPERGVVCGACVTERFAAELRCLYCGTEDDRNVIHESKGFVITMARAHTACAEEAGR
jgi:hypothetical protein